MAGAKRCGGGGGGEGEKRERENGREHLHTLPNLPSLFPSFQSPTTFDACYEGYQKKEIF